MAKRETLKTKVYYNSACPVCDAGIEMQRRKLEGCASQVEWIDVHADNAAAAEVGGNLEFIRERLHVVDQAGRINIGSEAFLALWALTPGQGALARIGGLPVMRGLFRWTYNAFAAALYRWNRRKGRW